MYFIYLKIQTQIYVIFNDTLKQMKYVSETQKCFNFCYEKDRKRVRVLSLSLSLSLSLARQFPNNRDIVHAKSAIYLSTVAQLGALSCVKSNSGCVIVIERGNRGRNRMQTVCQLDRSLGETNSPLCGRRLVSR